MPVAKNPGSLKTGHGKSAPDAVAPRPSLTGAGLAGPGPNIGAISTPKPKLPGALAVEAVSTHLDDSKGAHQASAIEHDGHPDMLWSSNVEGALDGLTGAITRRPPMLGEWRPDTTFSGIPDWGSLKLRDAGLENYGALTFTDSTVQNDANVYPYLLDVVGPARDTEFNPLMADPWSDWVFNTNTLGTVPGANYGGCHMGAFTRDGDVGPSPLPIYRTARLYPRPTGNDVETGRPARVPVTFSGTIFPADRGVLALLHFVPPRAGTVQASFLAQPLITDQTDIFGDQGRVVAAILLGNGILGDKCQNGQPCADEHLCDGDPGSIFAVGTGADGHYDPFAFPGRATGQYDLLEIHQGVDSDGNALKAPWDDFDGDMVAGTARTSSATTPAPGQVRLGTDPDAGTVVPYGIPILGGTGDWYDVAPVAQNGSLTYGIHGDAIVEDWNFFRYRLPVLKDYTPTTGLKWTPRGESATGSFETQRYFDWPAATSSPTYRNGTAITGNLTTAGVYDGFDEDFWQWQIARYRQTFLMPSHEVNLQREEVGTYLLVHFKKERDFERCVVDGIFPWDNEYEVYGVSPVVAPESVDNLANPWLAATAPVAPNGPAPAYGYAANPWHVVRNRIFLDPAGSAVTVTSSAFDWTSASAPGAGNEHIVWSSGVAYFTPRNPATGVSSFQITQLDINVAAGIWTSYRTDSEDLAGVGGIAPAQVASQNPVMIATAPWGYGDDGGAPALPSSLVVPVGAAGVGYLPSTDYQRQWRLEIPFGHTSRGAGIYFDDADAPLDTDPLILQLLDPIELVGDETQPSFSRNAEMRIHLRRPLNHVSGPLTNLPYTAAAGHGEALTHVTAGRVLLHTTRFDAANLVGAFGNFIDPVGPPHTSYAVLFDNRKDIYERFLDETYRVVQAHPSAATPNGIIGHGPYNATTVDHLNGPGMAGWAGGPVEVPTRLGLAAAPWNRSSWLAMNTMIGSLAGGALSSSLQVAGLPERNPRIADVNTMPFPSVGILQYPQIDYSAGYFPAAGVHQTQAQPSYVGLTGLRHYTRVFDAAFSDSGSPVVAAGQTEVTLRIDGITLADLAYAAPGPGGTTDNRIGLMVKVPGLTTWMDAGRADGAGPSKQDPLLDGAGCQMVSGSYTFTDPETGYKGCYVKVHVGPVAALFESTGAFSAYTAGTAQGEVPVLVKVLMDSTAAGYNLEREENGPGVFLAPSEPGLPSDKVRGVIGIRLVHPTDTLVDPD